LQEHINGSKILEVRGQKIEVRFAIRSEFNFVLLWKILSDESSHKI
jgi:hypothetical protein